MFELITMSLLTLGYINALVEESKEAKLMKEKERIRDLKIKVFCYAVRHHMLYDDVVKKLQNKELTFEDIDKENKK